jgi:hypothetical protein
MLMGGQFDANKVVKHSICDLWKDLRIIQRQDLYRCFMMAENSIRSVIWNKASNEIEALSQITASLIAGIDYGIIEAWWIPTESLPLPIYGRFSYYHVGLVVLMLIVSSALAWSHLQWIFDDRKWYVMSVCSAAIPLSLLVEDITWFVASGRPMRYGEWTMIQPGWGINVGFTWIPLWYLIVFSWSVIMLCFARRFADKGYKVYLRETRRSE